MTKSTTISVILYSRKDKNNQHPLKIRITENRKSIFHNVGWSVMKKDWSSTKQRVKTTHKDYREINHEIEKLLNLFSNQVEQNGVVKKSKIMVYHYIEKLIERKREENKFSTRKRYNTLLQHLQSFCKNEPLYFFDIDEIFLSDFKSFLEKSIKSNKGDGRPSPNSIHNYLGVLSSIINNSIREGIFIGENPFLKIHLPQKTRGSIKTLSKDEIWLLNNLQPDSEGMTEMIWNSLNVFLFCFWSQGLRISDCLELRYGDFLDGFFYKNMRKTNTTVKFPLTDKNIFRLIFSIEELPSFYNWELKKFPSTDLDNGEIDGDFVGVGKPYHNLTKEIEILGGWNNYQKDRIELYEEMETKLDNYNRRKQETNRVDFYFNKKWNMYSRNYHNTFRKESNEIGKHLMKQHEDSKELLIELCFNYFYEYCKNPLNKEKFVFPYLRGLEKNYTDKRWNKMSSSTSLINKYLKKVSNQYGIMNFSTHSSRHSFSSVSKEMGVDIYDLKEWLGHTSVKTTEGYINSIDSSRLKKHTKEISKLLDEMD
jgi:integrase